MGENTLAPETSAVADSGVSRVALVEPRAAENPLFRRAVGEAVQTVFTTQDAGPSPRKSTEAGASSCELMVVSAVNPDRFAAENVVLVLIDHMECADNLEAALGAVAEMADALPQTPCVFVTDCPDSVVAAKARELGAAVVLRKPIGVATLAGRLAELVGRGGGQHSIAAGALAAARTALVGEYSGVARLLVHDLRGPLTVLSSALSYLESEGLAAEGEELVWECQDALKRMCSMVNNVSSAAQFALGVMPPHADEFDLGVLVAEVVADMRDVFRLQALRVELNIATAAPMVGNADAIRRVVENLVANAAEYSPLEGVVSVAIESEQGDVVLRIGDEGIAVPATLIAASLELREQSRLKIQGVRLGKGLGLVVAREIVEDHHGTLTLKSGDSEFERGLVVEVRFRGT